MSVITTNCNEPALSGHAVVQSGEAQQTGSDPAGPAVHEAKLNTTTLAGGSSLETLGGGVAIVLAILGLTGILPIYMASIATIAIGCALLAHGAVVTARRTDTIRRAVAARAARVEVTGGVGAEIFGGMCAIALGVLALACVAPLVLLPVAAVVVGGAILLGAPAQTDIARVVDVSDQTMNRVTLGAVEASSGAMVLVGFAAVVMGIVALIHVGPALTLVMVAMLTVGGALLITGGALTAQFTRRALQLS